MKTDAQILFASLVLTGSLATLPAHAGELIASPLYSSSAAFDSLSNSSDQMGEGDYQIVRIEPAQTRDGYDRLTLRNPQAPSRKDYQLLVPTANVKTAALEYGQIIRARRKAYGMVFTTPGNETFAIVLNETWQKDMAPHKVL